MTPYEQGYQDAIRHIYQALGMAITQPLDEDHALGYLKIIKRERDDARAAYETETLSTAELAADNLRLERATRDAMVQLRTVEGVLRSAISRLETIRETHGQHIALDRDIEIYRSALPECIGQNSAIKRHPNESQPNQ